MLRVAPRCLHRQDTYGLEKLYHEEMCKAYAKDFPIVTRMARYHNVYGPRGTWKVIPSRNTLVRCPPNLAFSVWEGGGGGVIGRSDGYVMIMACSLRAPPGLYPRAPTALAELTR